MIRSGVARRWALSSAVTFVALVALWRFSDAAQLAQNFGNMRPFWALAALTVFLLSLFLRSLRLSQMYTAGDKGSWSFRTVTLAAGMNFLLPARLGELSLVALVARRLGQDYRSVALSVAVIRLQEFFLACFLALFWLVASGGEVQSQWWKDLSAGISSWLVVLIGAGVLTAVVALIRYWHHGLLRQPRGHARDPWLWMLSAGITLCMFALIFCVASWLNIAQAGTLTPLVFLAVLLVSFSPVNGLANVGGYHLAWVLPLIGLGYDREQAVSLAIMSHLVVFSMVVVALALALLWPESPGAEVGEK